MGVKESREQNYVADVPKSFYDIVEKKNNGEEFNFSELKGKVVYGLLKLYGNTNARTIHSN